MDVRGTIPEGGHQDLVHEFDHLAGRLVQAAAIVVEIFFLLEADVRQDLLDVLHRRFGGLLGPGIEEVLNILLHVLLDADGDADFLVAHQGADVIGLAQVLRIVHQDLDPGLVPSQRNPDIVEQEGFLQVVDELEGHRQFRIKGAEGASEEHRQRLADVLDADLETVDQHVFHALLGLLGDGQRLLQLLRADQVAAQQIIVAGVAGQLRLQRFQALANFRIGGVQLGRGPVEVERQIVHILAFHLLAEPELNPGRLPVAQAELIKDLVGFLDHLSRLPDIQQAGQVIADEFIRQAVRFEQVAGGEIRLQQLLVLGRGFFHEAELFQGGSAVHHRGEIFGDRKRFLEGRHVLGGNRLFLRLLLILNFIFEPVDLFGQCQPDLCGQGIGGGDHLLIEGESLLDHPHRVAGFRFLDS